MSYSIDFRRCVVRNIESGMSWEEAMRVFNISRSTIGDWCRKWRDSGDLSPTKYPARKTQKVNIKELVAAIEAQPDATLEELAAPFDVYPSTIDYHLRKLGITRKKNHAVQGAGRGKKTGISGRD